VSFRLQLLGAPRLAEGATDRHLPGRRALALLAIVALEGRVTRARAAALLWGDLDEASARRNLRRELARLREAGLGDLLDATAERLALAAGVGTDLDDGPAETPLLAGFELGDTPAFDAWLAERRDERQRAWREAARAEAAAAEARGDLRGALALQRRLLEADPLQEPVHAAVMRLHEALGERAAALEVFERCRRLLRDELGLEPLAATAALAERIRASQRLEPLLARSEAPAWHPLDAPLVGRDAEAARVRTATAPLLLVTGEPGVGKTRLVQESLLARDTLALRIEAGARGAALQVVAEAIAEALQRPPGDARAARLAALAPESRRQAARLVGALDPAARHDDAPSPALQQRFFAALADVLDALAGPGSTVLIDDLHWADEATLQLVRTLAHRRARETGAHPRLVATARAHELAEHVAARDTMLALEREGLLERLALAPLPEADTLALVRALSGSPGGALFAARLQRVTAGNPFFLLETLRFLFEAGELTIDERGQWATRHDDATADYAELPVPPTVAATVQERVDRLGAPARRVLEAAALAGDGFVLDEVQPATALSDWEALAGLERALQARVIVPAEGHDGGAGGGYRFVHDLARAALEAQLGHERRRRVHARIAATLATRGGRPDRVARHFEGAGDAAAAQPWHVRAAQDAARRFARREALEHYAAALAHGGPAAAVSEWRVQRVDLLRALGDQDGADAEVQALAALAGADGHVAQRALTMQGLRRLDRAQPAEALPLFERALALPMATPADELRLLRMAGLAALHLARGSLARGWLTRALALAERHQPEQCRNIDWLLIHLLYSAGSVDEACRLAEAGLARPDAGDPAVQAQLLNAAAPAFEAAGKRARALQCLQAARVLAQQQALGVQVVNITLALARMQLRGGEVALARTTQAQLPASGAQPLPWQTFQTVGNEARIAWAEGRTADAVHAAQAALVALEASASSASTGANVHALLARLHALTGDLDAAVAAADAAARVSQHPDEPPLPLLLAEAMHAWRALAAGDAGAAQRRLAAALAGPTALDEHWREHFELAHCVLAAAALERGDHGATLAALAPVRFSPALAALAEGLRVCAGAAADAARALLAGGKVPLPEAARLARALDEGLPPIP
jgi:DNA-binding SARP family transcriptional activator/tetratricopeptide (TPR) repeat protein